MNLPTKWAYNPFFAGKLAKFADQILLHGQKRFVFEAQFFYLGVSHPSLPHCSYGLVNEATDACLILFTKTWW